MPRLAAGFFEIKLGKAEASDLLEKRLKERGFGGFEIRELVLFFLPRYFFEYCIVSEGNVEGKQVVSGFSAEKGLFDPALKEILLGAPVLALAEKGLANEFEEDAEFRVVQPALKRNDAKKIARILLSKEKKAPQASIDIMDFSLVFSPVWRFKVEAGKMFFEVEINASTGALKELTPVPTKKQSWGEAAGETFSDLQQPKNWLSYFASIHRLFYDGLAWLARSPFLKRTIGAVWKSRDLQIAILVVILAILAYLATR